MPMQIIQCPNCPAKYNGDTVKDCPECRFRPDPTNPYYIRSKETSKRQKENRRKREDLERE